VKLYWRGAILGPRAARAGVFEAALFEGSALVESMRVKAGAILNLKLHEDRFAEGAKVALMPHPLQAGELSLAARALVKANRLKDGGLRCRYFRDGSLLILAQGPAKPLRGPIRLATTAQRHYGAASLQGRLKANSMLPNLLALWESMGLAEDGLRLTPQGFVAEGVWTNILIEKNGALITPPLSEGLLEGTTRTDALRRWRARGKPAFERPLTRYDLYTADKVWLCSSLRGMLQVSEVDGRKLGML
jgi:branched-chain amino acid aminotransferase